MTKFVKEAVFEPQDLEPKLKNIKQGIIEKHPAIIELQLK